MKFGDCTLSVLTWRTPRTLEHTLGTLAPIQNDFRERCVVCQEHDPKEIEISRQNGFVAIPLKENVGIQEGLAMCAEVSKTEFVVIVENDCPLVNVPSAMITLDECHAAFTRDEVDVIKLSAMDGKLSARYIRYWGTRFPPKKTWRGLLRPGEARACSGQIAYHRAFPLDGFSNVHKVSNHVYLTKSCYLSWTNRAFMIRREFFLNTIIKFARAHPAVDKVNGKPDLEKEIGSFWNRGWWRSQGFRVGIALPGLFGHNRIDRNNDDQKRSIHLPGSQSRKPIT